MAEHTHMSYTCDRCKADIGSNLPKHTQECKVQAQFNWESGPGPSFRWVDLCDNCRGEIFAFFKPNPWEHKEPSDG